MQKIKVITGYGYFVNAQGKKVHKYELPKGEHPLRDGLTQVEVASKEALDAIQMDEIVTPEMQAMRDKVAAREALVKSVKEADVSKLNNTELVEFLKKIQQLVG